MFLFLRIADNDVPLSITQGYSVEILKHLAYIEYPVMKPQVWWTQKQPFIQH